MNESKEPGYRYTDPSLNDSHAYLLPAVTEFLRGIPRGSRVFDLGCGNGAVANALASQGFRVVGIDASEEGVSQANRAYPGLPISLGSVYDDLASTHGTFDVVVSLEVVEHLYWPRKFAETAFQLLKPGGYLVISTPYHGYLKNLALAISGQLDKHFTALWDNGHIKFWSIATLSVLLKEAGFEVSHLRLVGRIPPFAKSMIAFCRRLPDMEQSR